MVELFADNGDTDQMPHFVMSGLGLHSLPVTHLGVSGLQWVNCLDLFCLLLDILGEFFFLFLFVFFFCNLLLWKVLCIWCMLSSNIHVCLMCVIIHICTVASVYLPSVHTLCRSQPRWLRWMGHPTGDQEVAGSTPPRSATFFCWDWSWNIFYDHSLPSTDSRRAVVSFWRKNVHNTG